MDVTSSFLALSASLRDGAGLAGLAAVLRRISGAPAAFVDLRGSLLASSPSRSQWPLSELQSWKLGVTSVGTPPTKVVPVTVMQDVEALLLAQGGGEFDAAQTFAADLAALEIGRLQAALAGRRELASQVLEDIFTGTSRGNDARDRLASLGILLDSNGHSVIVGRCDLSASQLRMRPWNLHSLLDGSGDPYLRATIGNDIVIVVPDSGAPGIAQVLLEHLRSFDTKSGVGVGPVASDPLSLAMSYFQAKDAAAGLGVGQARPLNLGYMLLGAGEMSPLREVSSRAMKPLFDHDERTGGSLVETLAVYLRTDCSVSAASDALFIHRNTLRYRLKAIADLTGWSMDTFEGRLHFWIAAQSLGFPETLGTPNPGSLND